MNTFLLFRNFHPMVNSLLAGTFILTVGHAMSLLFLPMYLLKNTEMDAGMIGLIVGAGPLASTFGGFIGGALSDFLGRRRMLLGSLYVSSLFFFGFVWTKHPVFLAAIVVMIGLCHAFYGPVAKALMGDLTSPELRMRVFSIRYVIVNIGYAIGPALGAFFVAKKLESLPFFLTGCIELGFAIALHFLFGRFKIREVGLQTDVEKRISLGDTLRVVRSDTALFWFILGGMLVMIVEGQWSVPLTMILELRLEEAANIMALLVGVNAVGVILLQVPLSIWSESKNPFTVITVGCILCGFGMAGIAFSYHWIAFAASIFIFTIGEVLVTPIQFLLLDRITPEGLRGTYYGAQSLTSLGSFLGPWISGILISNYGGELAFLFLGLVIICSILVFKKGLNYHERKKIATSVVEA